MAKSKWKYAGTDASQRLKMLNMGNKELFDEEVARTREVTNARRELGLDTTEQEKWMDTVGYNYSLYLAADDDKDNVSKTGYAELYLNPVEKEAPSPVAIYKSTMSKPTPYISNAKRKIEAAKELAVQSARMDYENAVAEAKKELYGEYPYIEEALVNDGADLRGGKAKKVYAVLEARLDGIKEKLGEVYEKRISELETKYSNMTDELMEYRKNGTAKEYLGVIADVLVKNAALEDGFDAFAIPGVGGKKGTSQKKDDTITEKTVDTSEQTKEDVEAFVPAIMPKDTEEVPEENTDESEKVKLLLERGGDTVNTYLAALADAAEKKKESANDRLSGMLEKYGMSKSNAAKLVSEFLKLISEYGVKANKS